MHTYTEVKRAAKAHVTADVDGAKSLVVLGDVATQHLATAIQGAADLAGVPLEVIDTDYDQVRMQVMDSGSELNTSGADYALLYLSWEKLRLRFYGTPLEERHSFAEKECDEIVGLWSAIAAGPGCTVLQTTFVEADDGVYGCYAAKVETSLTYQVRKLNYLLTEAMASAGGVFPVDLAAIESTLGRDASFSPRLWYAARLTPDTRALPHFAERVVAVIRALMGDVKKCVVLDLDNTLWGGVIGDDGMEGIQLGELGVGRAHTDLQLWLRELRRRGIILAVCSKNDESVAKEPFKRHPDMVLRMDDISCFIANWEDKASNIRRIRDMLEIGLDSMVFLDDNPFEREAVRSLVPGVCVPELPEDPAEWLSLLRSLDLFETATHSANDAARTEQYRAEAGRREAAREFGSYDDYLASLQMVGAARPFDEFHVPRIAQLTQRSNQFNLRTIRYTEEAVREVVRDPSRIGLYFELRDRFGDHGLVSVAILELRGDEAFVDTWLMSCRVLRRGMEEFVADRIVGVAREAGCTTVVGEYLPTRKNGMVADLYERMGFERVGKGRYLADVESYQQHRTHIEEEG